MKITKIITILESSAYNNMIGFLFIRTSDGKSVRGKVSGGSGNLLTALAMTNKEWKANYFTCYERNIKQSDISRFPYAGCSPGEILKYVKKELRKKI